MGDTTDAQYAMMSVILVVLAFAFLSMGVMEYFSNDCIEDKELRKEMSKCNKGGLLEYENNADLVPDYMQ